MRTILAFVCFLACAAHGQTLDEMLSEDQKDRRATSPEQIDWLRVSSHDAAHRAKVQEMIEQGKLSTAAEYFAAALIFQHGTEPADYERAHELATTAAKLDPKYPGVMWLKAASWDRLLISRKQKQWYGTQFKFSNGKMSLLPIEPGKVSDAQRVEAGIRPLSELQANVPSQYQIQGLKLKSWICAAALCSILAHSVTGDASPANTGATSPNANALIEEAGDHIRRLAYYADRVDWDEAVAVAKREVADEPTAQGAYAAIDGMLRKLRDGHSFLLRSDRAKSLLENNAVDDIAISSKDLGDVVIVEVPTFAGTQAIRERTFATRLHSSFERDVRGAPRCGWVVDLRKDMGGNMFPMLAGLAPLLGTEGLGSFVSRSGSAQSWPTRSVFARAGMDIAQYESPDLRSAPVAVITGPYTMSSGEAVAIAFRGRPNTRSFGAPTSGKSTGNEGIRLSDGSMLLLTTELMADRNGVRFGEPIQPDELVYTKIGATTDDDEALGAALGWLRGRCKSQR